MQLVDGRPVYAATDLIAFLACEHWSGLELAALAGLVERPVRNDPEIELVAKRGLEHERRYLDGLAAAGRRVTEIRQDEAEPDRGLRLRRAARDTEAAIRRGDDVVYQAVFFDGRWLGLADFLVRVETPSGLGPWSYEVVDTKLARHVKASAILQICSYVDQLTRIQGREPEWLHVALGGSAREVVHERVGDYMAYYRRVKSAFEARVAAFGAGPGAALAAGAVAYPPAGSYPEPVEHCEVCRWAPDCRVRRRRDDDLSLVAGAPARVRRRLKERSILTRRALAVLELPLAEPLDGVGAEALVRVHEQARIQVAGETAGRVIHELLPPPRRPDGSLEPNRGLLSLPEPRPGDLFFDIEGDPFAMDDGVDYLFGILEPGATGPDGEPLFHAFWAIDDEGHVTREAEKRAFEAAIDLMIDRLARDPEIHVYHYAPYEPTAAGRLMGRHATREEEVDRLLRGDIFVDLFRAVRQGLRASVESYSIKKLEPLYGLEREVDLRDAGSSIVAFEAWLAESEGGDGPAAAEAQGPHGRGRLPAALERIEGYNRDDCVSNWKLRDWLERERTALSENLGETLPRPVPPEAQPSPGLSERLARVAAVAERLAAEVPVEEAERTPEQHARWLLAQLLSWHRREEKAFWWRYYYLLELTPEELIGEREPIGGLEFVELVGERKKSLVYRYRYPEQEHAIDIGTEVRDPATGRSPGAVEAVDLAARTIDLRRGPKTDGPHPRALVPCDYISTQEIQDSLLRIGEWVADHGIDAPGAYRVGRDLLLRRRPRLAGSGEVRDGETLAADREPLDAARALAPRLDATTLAVQGPPGSGKTYLGSRVVADLVRAGWKVGVTANSHKVIGHLLDEVAKRARDDGVEIRLGQKKDAAGRCASCEAEPLETNGDVAAALRAGTVDVVGGTAWVWSRPELADALDALVVDEAGQVSLANLVAVSPAARNLILLGDPQQLEQPLQGTHPPGAEASALGHVLGREATMPPDRGLFMERTRRLHPDLCRFTSEVFYEGRLEPEPWLAAQRVVADGELAGTGVRLIPVTHEANRNESIEEAETVARLVRGLVDGGASWIDDAGQSRRLGIDDAVVVAPYNAQVAAIERALPGGRVGTVDRFQGQEAPIAIYSMATSTPEEAPRGMEFLYSLHRLNVATSRGRCVAAIVASPALVRVDAKTPRQMRLANALCRFVELAEGAGEVATASQPSSEPSAAPGGPPGRLERPAVATGEQLSWTSLVAGGDAWDVTKP